jgi:hypothetical protein
LATKYDQLCKLYDIALRQNAELKAELELTRDERDQLRLDLAAEIETAWDLASDTRVSMIPFHGRDAVGVPDQPTIFSPED